MQTIFNPQTTEALITRIHTLSPSSSAQWGKMNAAQMLKHCNLSEEMYLGKKQYSRLFIGRLFGKMALKSVLQNEDEMKPNQPTHPEFQISGDWDFEAERQKWIGLLQDYAFYSNPKFVHPFFGKMTREQVGQYVYKHTDHHLRQFGC